MSLQNTMLALSDPTRRRILSILKQGEKSAGEISDLFEISQPAISRHLSVLKNADLVKSRREGKQMVYSLSISILEEALAFISELKGDPL
ncbi:autorepressor SdpR family transcription factor [Ileibacterium valens]|uniref:autorepressor SdpR family transcription factor n=1 Tax=Ileibacterium valens TaxID=1862668 RepID=UPI0024BB2F63|nr:autorepressor SdpR family transcription factor [Ileibacterium valens]